MTSTDNIYIGALNLGIIWKASIIVISLLLMTHTLKIYTNQIIVWYCAPILLMFVSGSFFDGIIGSNIEFLLKGMTLFFVYNLCAYFKAKNVNFVIYIAAITLLSINSLMYVGVIPATGNGYNLSIYDTNRISFGGSFANPHAMGIAMFLIFYIVANNRSKNRNLILAGSTFFAYLSNVRMVTIMLLSFFIENIGLKKLFRIHLLILILAFLSLFMYLLNTDHLFAARWLDTNKYNAEFNIWNFASGRPYIWFVAISNWLELSIWQQIFGIGRTGLYNLLGNTIGVPLPAHNEFLNILISGGVLGLLLFLTYITKLIRLSGKFRSQSNRGVLIVFPLLVFYIFQGGYFIYADCIVAYFLLQVNKGYHLELYH